MSPAKNQNNQGANTLVAHPSCVVKKIFASFVFGILFLIPVVTFAQSQPSLIDNASICTGPGGAPNCTIGDFFRLIQNVINFFIRYIFTPVVTLLIGWIGIKLVTAGDKASARSEAKTMLWKVFWGAVWVLAGFLIIKLIVTGLQTKDFIVNEAFRR